MKQREALFQRFGYDSAASLKFILAKGLPLPGRVVEIGTGKGGFLAQLGKHADHITTLDIDADQQRWRNAMFARPDRVAHSIRHS